jgi:pimeloyl-ACP methyl ester carboxylesterase
MTETAAGLQYVESVDGTPIAYRRVGRGQPLVVVHGGLGSRASYAAVAELLADDLEVYLFDRRGRGGSGWGSEPHTLRQETDDARVVLDLAGPDAAVLGHSYGGTVVLDLLAEDATGVAAVVLYEPGVGFGAGDVEALVSLSAAGDHEALLIEAFEQLVENGGISESERQAAIAARPSPEWDALVAVAPTIVREMTAVAGFVPDRDRLSALDVPALVLLGTESGARHHQICSDLCHLLSDARLEVLEGQGHVAHIASPTAIATAVRAFLERA